MSRSGYSEYDDDIWATIRWRGAVKSAIKGKRGQALLKEMAAALDAMPVQRLIAGKLINSMGEVCALGAVAKARQMDVSGINNIEDDYVDREAIAARFGIAGALAAEIMHENDQELYDLDETPEERWNRVRIWVDENLKDKK